MGRFLITVLSLTSFSILCIEAMNVSHQRPPPTCAVKQLLWEMKFPIPYCPECHSDTCFVTKLTADAETQIKNIFAGLFYSTEHISKVKKANTAAASQRPKRHLAAWRNVIIDHATSKVENVNDGEGRHGRMKRGYSADDGDVHCPTKLDFKLVTRMTNINGVERELVHLSALGEYQWVLEGSCARVNEDCPRGCTEEVTSQYLLVWNLANQNNPMTFEPFDIKAYCSCKNFS